MLGHPIIARFRNLVPAVYRTGSTIPAEPCPSYYTLRSTHGRQATIYVAPDDGPWQAATQYARASFASDSQLAELLIASEAETLAFTVQA